MADDIQTVVELSKESETRDMDNIQQAICASIDPRIRSRTEEVSRIRHSKSTVFLIIIVFEILVTFHSTQENYCKNFLYKQARKRFYQMLC